VRDVIAAVNSRPAHSEAITEALVTCAWSGAAYEAACEPGVMGGRYRATVRPFRWFGGEPWQTHPGFRGGR
jgi:hypothetical protein